MVTVKHRGRRRVNRPRTQLVIPLPDDINAASVAAGRSLALIVEEHGERDSATFSPRFLMHDGLREADMAPDVYERLFLFAHEFENCFSGEPSFQYILTTTTQPPDKFQSDPWLRLRLAGMPAKERLLRCDL